MGSKVKIFLSCDRCGHEYEEREVEARNINEELEANKKDQSGDDRGPLFVFQTYYQSAKKYEYVDVCEHCKNSLLRLIERAGKIQRGRRSPKKPVVDSVTKHTPPEHVAKKKGNKK